MLLGESAPGLGQEVAYLVSHPVDAEFSHLHRHLLLISEAMQLIDADDAGPRAGDILAIQVGDGAFSRALAGSSNRVQATAPDP